MAVVDHVRPAPGSHDRRLGRLGEGGQRGGNTGAVIVAVLVGRIGSIEGPAEPHPSAGDDDGRSCTSQRAQDRRDICHRWLRPLRSSGFDDQGT